MIGPIGWEEFDDKTDRQTTNRRQTDIQTDRQIQVMIYDAERVRRLCTKFQVNTSKNKNFHFGGSFFGGEGVGAGDWTAVNIKS